MNALLRDRLRSSWWAQGTLAVAVLILLAAGFCVFDVDHDASDHALHLNLCLIMLVTSLTIMLPTRLPLTGLAAPYRPLVLSAPPLRTPAPPPKSFSHF